MVNNLQISEKITLDDLELLKILSDPTRMEIMKLVGTENRSGRLCTVKQLAQLMGASPTKLYYHVKMLEERGLLIVGNTRVVSGIIEKQYHVIALDISFSQNALSMTEGPKDSALQDVFKSVDQIVGNSLRNFRASLTAIHEDKLAEKKGGPPARKQVAMQINRNDLLLRDQQAIAFEERLVEIMEEFKKLSNANLQEPKEDTLYYEVTQMFVPQYQRKVEMSKDDGGDGGPEKASKKKIL